MKNSLLFAVFACITFSSFGQYSRSFYTEETSKRRHSSLIAVNGETTVISIRESSNDTLRVTLIDIDDEGETSNYRSYEYSPFDVSSAFVLSGVGTNSAGQASLCVLNPNGSNNVNISYINIDPSTGTFSNYSNGNGQYREAFSRTRAKGDSLISYLALSSGSGIQRVAKSMSTTSISFEMASASLTFSENMSQNKTPCDVILDGNDEYISLTNQIIKRIGPNNYIETTHSSFFDAPCMTVNSSGNLFVLSRNNSSYQLLDGNLTELSSGTIPDLQFSSSGPTEIYALANDGIRIWTRRSTQTEIIDIDANGVIVNKRLSRCEPLNQFQLNGNQYVIGFQWDHNSAIDINGNEFQNTPISLAIVSDDLSSSIPEFIEYDQILSSDKIRFHVDHTGRSFTNESAVQAGFSFKQNNLWRNLIYSSAANIIGETINGATVGSTTTYQSTAATGPYCSPGNYTMETMDKYNRGYYVTREMIDAHIWEITAGTSYYEIPFGIKEWPAHGDVSLGQAANLANFFDQNGNGIYEPELGDYPSIYGDQCLLNIYHQHPSGANSSSIETHQYYFTFDCDAEEAIENAVFVRSHNFSREQTLFNTYAGNYADFDLGNFSDDYVGTNVALGMIYAYNGDQFDETNGGNLGFNDTIPAVGLLALQGMKLDEDGIDNSPVPIFGGLTNGIGFGDNIVDNEYHTMESSYAHFASASGFNSLGEFYNTMKGLYPNGSPKEINGVTIRHDFFGTSDPVFYSSFGVDHGNNYSEDLFGNPAGDRRMSCSSGPVVFNTVDTMVLVNAFVVGVDTVALSPDSSLVRLFENGEALRDFYAQNLNSCGDSFDPFVSDLILSVEEEEMQQIFAYPNPTNHLIHFRGIQGEGSVQIIDLNGRVVLSEFDIQNDNGIDISQLEKAVYLIQISDENGTQTIRMIKQ